MSKTLTGRVALVTGATRGLGCGIAIGLGEAGATVYITGRSRSTGDSSEAAGGSDPVGGSLEETCAAVEAAGGTCSAHRVDHHDDDQVRELFVRIGNRDGASRRISVGDPDDQQIAYVVSQAAITVGIDFDSLHWSDLPAAQLAAYY